MAEKTTTETKVKEKGTDVIVFDPKTEKEITVNTGDEPKWKTKYYHRNTHKPFEK